MPPARRHRGNLLALALLGLLMQRPMHPYEMATTLRDYGKDSSIKLRWGSLYTVVQSLAKNGLIEVTATTRQGGRPERTVYGITEAGRAELGDWLRELLSVPEREYPQFEAALSLLSVLPPDEATALLESRLRGLQAEVVAQRTALEHYRSGLPRLFLIESEFHLALLEAETVWVRSLVAELSAGTFPQQAEWLHFHRTGVVPENLFGPDAGTGPGADGPATGTEQPQTP